MTTKTTKAKKATVKKAAPKKEVRPPLPRPVVSYVWMRSGGRCAFPGCNIPLWKDLLTNERVNAALIAHIISWTPTGPRGDAVLSPQLAKDASNLMLLCHTHHERVDNDVAQFTVDVLRDYKARHEKRIEMLTGIDEDRRTTMVLLQAAVGPHADPMRFDHARLAAAEAGHYPREEVITIDLTALGSRDHEMDYWPKATRLISARLQTSLTSLRHSEKVDHVSVFAFAPIPLLIHLGRELGDKIAASTYNLHRDPKGWRWPRDARRFKDYSSLPEEAVDASATEVGLLVSVTSNVQREHVRKVLPEPAPLFELRSDAPVPDLLRHPDELTAFARAFQGVMERIHNETPRATRIHLFAGVPVACAVEMGRSLLPKVHAPIQVYDFHQATQGFVPAIEIRAS